MGKNNDRCNNQGNFGSSEPDHCEEIRISRLDLKKKNYKTAETRLTEKACFQGKSDQTDQTEATLDLLDRMWLERRNFCGGGEEKNNADSGDICQIFQ